MIFSVLSKSKSLCYRIAFASITLFYLFALAGCSSINPMTRQVYFDVMKYVVVEEEQDEIIWGINGFLFYISKDIRMVYLHSKISREGIQERLREWNIREEVFLNRRTPGRLMDGSISGALNVSFEKRDFEERDKKYPRLSFVQKAGAGPDDKYYFMWNKDEETGERYIEYEGGHYVVYYEGDEEPYLLYRRMEREIKKRRKMPGLRELPYEYIEPITP